MVSVVSFLSIWIFLTVVLLFFYKELYCKDINSDSIRAEPSKSSISLAVFSLRKGNNYHKDNMFVRENNSHATAANEESIEYEENRGSTPRLLQRIRGFGGDPPSDAYPLQVCQGDCDEDSDCDEGLVCHQRDKDTVGPVPGCIGTARTRTDYCVLASLESSRETSTDAPTKLPTRLPTLNPTSPLGYHVGNSETNLPISESFLDQSDTLRKVDRLVEAPPPLYTEPTMPPTAPLTTKSFRIKLYWEDGYMWQDSPRERRWCMTYNYNGFPGTGKCWYGEVTQPCNPLQIFIAECQDDGGNDSYNYQQQQQFRFEFIHNNDGTARDGEILIATAGDTERNSNKCLERLDHEIYLEPCDIANPRQRWYAMNGDFTGERFEIAQKQTGFFYDQCINQAHHPKPGEVIEMLSCERARSEEHQTSYWNRY